MTADAAATVDKNRTRREQLALSAWCVVAAFGTYFCMYAFRRPFTAAEFADYSLWGVGYKTVLVSSQVIGYTISKFVGIKVVSEMAASRRAGSILVLIAIAQVSLLLFGLVPPPYNFVCLFLNGLPLGMVFGLVLCFLEGRRVTEALNAGLCASFILADGVTKSVGAYLLQAGVSQFWMPFAAGLFFIPALLLFVWMLAQIPPPGPSDVALRSLRTPMNRGERRGFFRRYSLGIVLIVLVYLLVTVMRSIRADFAPEIWSGLGYSGQPSVFARSELLVVLAVMAVCGLGFLDRRQPACLLLCVKRRSRRNGSAGGGAARSVRGLAGRLSLHGAARAGALFAVRRSPHDDLRAADRHVAGSSQYRLSDVSRRRLRVSRLCGRHVRQRTVCC